MIVFQKEYDVIVIGGGVAGVAAAVQAARCGLHTALIEKGAFAGGLATAGLVYVYLPICDGNGHQATFGIAEELLHISQLYGPGNIPDWKSAVNAPRKDRFGSIFSPAAFSLALDELLETNNVDVWYDSLFCCSRVDSNRRVEAIEIENKSGRGLLKAKCFVDATGDADLARNAGAQYTAGRNILAFWCIEYLAGALVKDNNLAPGINLFMKYCNPGKDVNAKYYKEISGHSVSEFLMSSRRLLREHYKHEYSKGQTRTTLFPLLLPSMATFRTTYSVETLRVLKDGDNEKYFSDSIGMVADWREPGSVWEVPYSSMVPKNIDGILCAGRCIGAIENAWSVTRVIPGAAMTGQVAGMAAALTVKSNTPSSKLNIELLQNELRNCGFKLHIDELQKK